MNTLLEQVHHYDNRMRESTRAFGNGLTQTISYETTSGSEDDVIKSIVTNSSTLTLTYTYDNNKNLSLGSSQENIDMGQ